MRSWFHIAIRVDFHFYAQSPLFRVCFLCVARFGATFCVSVNKACVQSNNFVFVFITALIAKTSVYFDKESLHFETWRSLPMHVYKIENLKSYSEG